MSLCAVLLAIPAVADAGMAALVGFTRGLINGLELVPPDACAYDHSGPVPRCIYSGVLDHDGRDEREALVDANRDPGSGKLDHRDGAVADGAIADSTQRIEQMRDAVHPLEVTLRSSLSSIEKTSYKRLRKFEVAEPLTDSRCPQLQRGFNLRGKGD